MRIKPQIARKMPAFFIRNYYGLRSKIKDFLRKIAQLILGVHPNNTFLSFNWHNVRHINNFLKKTTEALGGHDLSLADIGGGDSPYFYHFSSMCSEYIVVDLEEALPKDEARSIRQIIGTAEDIPLDDSSVDIVLCNQVLEHVIDPIKSVAEIYRILKPNGYFIGSVPHVSPIHLEPYDFRRYTSLGIEQLLSNEGFSNISVEGNGGVFSTAALMISMDLLLSRRRRNQPQEYNAKLAVMMSPVIGLMNLAGLLADKILGDKSRTPANLCWITSKG